MAFEIIKKNTIGNALKEDELSINDYGMSFGENVQKHFSDGKNHVEVYFDLDGKRVGLKPTDNSVTGYKVTNYQGKNCATSGQWIKRILSKGRHKVVVEEDMLVISNIDIAKGGEDGNL